MQVGDHDYTKFGIIRLVCFIVDIPDVIQQSNHFFLPSLKVGTLFFFCTSLIELLLDGKTRFC